MSISKKDAANSSIQPSLFDFDNKTYTQDSFDSPSNAADSLSNADGIPSNDADSFSNDAYSSSSRKAHIWNPNLNNDEWIAKLEPTDADALALENIQLSFFTTEQAAKLWSKLAAWAQSDQIAYYVEDSPTSSDAAYDARMRMLSSLESAFPTLDLSLIHI